MDKGFRTFSKCICPKLNVIVRLEFELAYYDVVVENVNYYSTGTFPKTSKINLFDLEGKTQSDKIDTIDLNYQGFVLFASAIFSC